MQLQKQVLIDVSADNSNSTAAQCDGLLLSGIEFPATMTGSNVTFDFSYLRVTSDGNEAADRKINLVFKQS
jgi:hypothetical protein